PARARAARGGGYAVRQLRPLVDAGQLPGGRDRAGHCAAAWAGPNSVGGAEHRTLYGAGRVDVYRAWPRSMGADRASRQLRDRLELERAGRWRLPLRIQPTAHRLRGADLTVHT